MTDWQLIQEFVSHGSEDAFAEVVRRYVKFVRQLCRREISEEHLCDEVVQAVFTVLALKARKLRPETILAGWLIHTARYACANALRIEFRRRRNENAARMALGRSGRQTGTDTGVTTAALLDEGLERLSRGERDAVLLKVVEGRKLSEVAALLKISESAAEKRAARGLEKLKGFFSDGNAAMVSLTGLGLTRCGAVQAMALTKTALSANSTGALAKGTMSMLFWTRVKAAGLRIALMLLLGTGLFAMVRGGEENAVSREDLLLSPQQDEETLKKAWRAFVTIDYSDTSATAVLADFSKQSGIEIRIDPECKLDLRGSGGEINGMLGFNWSMAGARARTFLTSAQCEQIKGCKGRKDEGSNAAYSIEPDFKSFEVICRCR